MKGVNKLYSSGTESDIKQKWGEVLSLDKLKKQEFHSSSENGQSKEIIFTNSELKDSLNYLMEVNDVESDVADLTNRLDDLSDIVDDNVGRMGYVRQLTAEFLELLIKLTSELDDDDVEIPETLELITKMMGRQHRKRYYMSKFRL